MSKTSKTKSNTGPASKGKSGKSGKSGSKPIIIFTDGSCSANGSKNAVGGIGIHFPNGELKDLSRVFRTGQCTNQRAELYAILTAIRYVKKYYDLDDCAICIKTDSKYSIDCVTKWVYGWIKNGWMTQNKTPVANKEFIEMINKYYDRYDIEFIHVNGHSKGTDADSVGNNVADKLATSATERAQLASAGIAGKIQIVSKKASGSGSGSKSAKKSSNANNRRTNSRTSNRAAVKKTNSGRQLPAKKQGFPRDNNFIVELVKK